MNGKIFGNSLVKSGFVAFALALGLAACGDGESTNGPSNNHENTNISSVESEENLPSCTESREGFVNFINGTKEGFVCKDRKWVHYDMIADIDDNLPGCTGSREGLDAYLYEEDRELNCVEGSWDVVGEVASSSSSEKSGSSSSREKDGSSSSVAPNSSSSVILSDSEGSSSSSAKSSSSVANSSSMKAAWAYLNPDIDYGEFTDERDGQVYKTVKIGTQTWMAENLNYDPGYVSSMGGYAWSGCYSNKDDNCSKYGRLYTWEVAMDNADCAYGKKCNASLKPATPVRGVCPQGWHLPSHYEFEELINFIDPTFGYNHTDNAFSSTAGWYLRSQSGWKSGGNGSDTYGFSALPGGKRFLVGGFGYEGSAASFWSSGEYNSGDAFDSDGKRLGWVNKFDASSVRCIQDSNSVTSSSSVKIDYGEFTDERDGQVYKTVKIGTQTWMAENLNYAYTGVKYNYSSYTSDSTSWCYENKASNCDKYGRLYTWSAVMDSAAQFSVNAGTRCGYGKTCTPNSPHRGICPEGWHVPTNEEYSTLYTYIGGSSTAGSLLKSTSGWYDSGNGTDKYGFSVLPAGERYDSGNFYNEGKGALLWSASQNFNNDAWRQYFNYDLDYAHQDYCSRSLGRSLRCLKDSSSVTSSSSVASSSSMKAAWAYLNPKIDYGEFTDERDGQVYKTVKIGYQTWMAENLNYAYTGVKYNYDIFTSDSTSWCYKNKASNCDKYGRFYTWSAVMDSAAQFNVNAGTKCGYGKTCTPNSPHRGICPEGWHVPTDEEYSTLYTYIGGSSTAGSLLKSTSGWYDSGNGTDKYGFSVLPAGYRRGTGYFDYEGYDATLWSASEDNSDYAWYQYFAYSSGNGKNLGQSLRCLKDS